MVNDPSKSEQQTKKGTYTSRISETQDQHNVLQQVESEKSRVISG